MSASIRVFDPNFGDRTLAVPVQLTPGQTSLVGIGNLASGSIGLSPGTTGSDIVLGVFTIPVGGLAPGASGVDPTINLYANGVFANNGNTKRAKIIVGATNPVVGSAVSGGTVIADTGNYSTASLSPWSLGCMLVKYGAFGANTQIAFHQPSVILSTVAPLVGPTALNLNENAPINIVITGNATTTATDVVYSYGYIEPIG